MNLHALYKENHLYATFYIKKRQKKGRRKRVLMETWNSQCPHQQPVPIGHGFSGSINEWILKRIEEIGKLRSLFGNSFSQSFFVFGEGKCRKTVLLGDFWWMHGEWIIFVSTFCEGDGGAQKIDGSHNLFSVMWGPLPVLYIVVPDQV